MQVIENNEIIVVPNVENDESTSLGNALKFEVPPAKVESLRKVICKGGIKSVPTKTVLQLTTCLVHTRTGPKFN